MTTSFKKLITNRRHQPINHNYLCRNAEIHKNVVIFLLAKKEVLK